jgi:rod shape-determining protein MreD
MRKFFLFLILLFVALFLQFLLTGWTEKIRVDFFLLLTVFWSQSRGWKEGVIAGFFCGLVKDIFFFPFLGINAFSLVLVSWLVNEFQNRVYQQNAVFFTLLVGLSSLFYSTILSLWLAVFYRFSFVSSFLTSSYPALFYNCGFSFGIFTLKEMLTRRTLGLQSNL